MHMPGLAPGMLRSIHVFRQSGARALLNLELERDTRGCVVLLHPPKQQPSSNK
jgi:hypothetical protein